MAEGTRFRKLKDAQENQATQIQKLFETSNQTLTHITQLRDASTKSSQQITELTAQTNHTAQRFNDLQTTLTSIMGRLDQLTLTNSPPPPPPPPPPHFPPVVQPRPFRLDFPRFDGDNPTGWIFKATQFFDFHQTPPIQRLQIASFHMDGPALAWFQWMSTNCPFQTWDDFIQALETRFGDSPYTDHMGSLAKLQQWYCFSLHIQV